MLSQLLSHRANQSSLPPPDLSLPLPLCRSPLFTSNPPVSVSVPVARQWLLPSSVSLCHTLAAPAVSLPLLLSPSISSLCLSFSPSLSHCPSLPRFLVFHSTADLGEIIVGDKFLCLPLTQRKGLRLDLQAPGSLCIQASGSSLFSPSSFSHSHRHLKPVKYAWHRVCVVDAVYIG